MSNIDRIRALTNHEPEVEKNTRSTPTRLTELNKKDRDELEQVVRDPNYFISWIQANFPEYRDIAIKILDRVRYVSRLELTQSARELATKIEKKAAGKKVVLLADYSGRKSRKSTWLMRELSEKQSWELIYPSEVIPDDNTLYVFLMMLP